MSFMDLAAFKMIFGIPDQLKTQVMDKLYRPYLHGNDLLILLSLSAKYKPRKFLEIGLNEGKTARMILDYSPWIEKYIGVDVLPGYSPVLAAQVGEVPLIAGICVKDDPRVEMIVTKEGSKNLTVDQIDGVDMAFIDGDHSFEGVKIDTQVVEKAMKKGGVIIWHDYCSGNCKVRQYIDKRNANGNRVCLISHSNICFEVL